MNSPNRQNISSRKQTRGNHTESVFNLGHPCCFRVALQYEFTKLHLDDVLERLKNHESEELAVQISAYVDNEFDIAVLMEEAEEKVAAMERVADLEDEVGRLNETMQELEVNAMATQVCSACRAPQSHSLRFSSTASRM